MGNAATALYRYGAQILTPGNASVGTTVSPAPMSFMTGGTTADSNTTALGTLKGKKYYYQISAAEDATRRTRNCTGP